MLESYAMVTTPALLAAARAGLFEALGDGGATPGELAAPCGTDPGADAKLLRMPLTTGTRMQAADKPGRAATPA